MGSPAALRDAYVWPHLGALPAFRALIRAIEHRLLDDYRPFAAPLLDVGAGDGHFASVALGPRVAVGVDVSLPALREATRRGVYEHLTAASATALPFPDAHFATVVANCAIEHIPDLHATLGEFRRVLRPGGRLLVTVPTDRLEPNLIVPRALGALGLGGAADGYTAWFRRQQVHYHLLSRGDWLATLRGAGFTIVAARGYMSARATKYFELGHYAGLDNLAARRLSGRWVLWPWRPRFAAWERLIAACVAEPEHPDDSCLLVVAERA